MKIDVIVGGLYGDEGKGKIVSNLGNKNKYNYIFRVNASTNASHSVQLDDSDEIIVTKQLPSVFFNKEVKFVVGPGAVLNLEALREEVYSRPDDIKNKVSIASTICILIRPYIEATIKSNITSKLGSTNQGTGIAVLARTRRHCLRLYDISNAIKGNDNKRDLVEKIKFTCSEIDKEYFLTKNETYYEEVANELIEDYKKIEQRIGKFEVDYSDFLYNLPKDSKILIEGCNGIMLDNLHGLNPYTTSASTSINALLNGANLSPYDLNKTYIICSGYFCCLNKRPFVTEMTDEESAYIYKNNSEVDDAEGMQRRLGWFDLPTLNKSLVGHKGAELIINKLDIMKDIKDILVCIRYELDKRKVVNIMPDNIKELESAKPIYVSMDGWGDISNITAETIPQNLRDFIRLIEEETGFKVAYIGTGRKEKDLIKL